MTKTAVAAMPSPQELVEAIAALSVEDFTEVVERLQEMTTPST